MSEILRHSVRRKIQYILKVSNKNRTKNRLISIDIVVNRLYRGYKTPVKASGREFNSFCTVFGLSCRELRQAKEAFACSWTARRQIYSVIWRWWVAWYLAGSPIFYWIFLVKMGKFYLTFCVKMGYNVLMFASFISFVLRIWLIAVIWVFVWRFVEPRTQLMRILRAALLLLGLLGVLAALRIMGRWLRPAFLTKA